MLRVSVYHYLQEKAELQYLLLLNCYILLLCDIQQERGSLTEWHMT